MKTLLFGLAVIVAPVLGRSSRAIRTKRGGCGRKSSRRSRAGAGRPDLSQDQATKLRATQERYGTRGARRWSSRWSVVGRSRTDAARDRGEPDSVRKLMDGMQTGARRC